MNQRKSSNNTTEFRKSEDLNVIDNFLFQQLVSEGEDGEEFVRILLSTILGRPIRRLKIVPQKNVLGIDTDRHGIRMDAYIQEVFDEECFGMADVELIPYIYDMMLGSKGFSTWNYQNSLSSAGALVALGIAKDAL